MTVTLELEDGAPGLCLRAVGADAGQVPAARRLGAAGRWPLRRTGTVAPFKIWNPGPSKERQVTTPAGLEVITAFWAAYLGCRRRAPRGVLSDRRRIVRSEVRQVGAALRRAQDRAGRRRVEQVDLDGEQRCGVRAADSIEDHDVDVVTGGQAVDRYGERTRALGAVVRPQVEHQVTRGFGADHDRVQRAGGVPVLDELDDEW